MSVVQEKSGWNGQCRGPGVGALLEGPRSSREAGVLEPGQPGGALGDETSGRGVEHIVLACVCLCECKKPGVF